MQESVRAGVKRFVYAASSTCYGFPDVFPTPEDARHPPAISLCADQISRRDYHHALGPGLQAAGISLRMFNVYGPRARTSGTYGAVFGVFLAQMLADEPVTIVGDGNQTRDFTFVSGLSMHS